MTSREAFRQAFVSALALIPRRWHPAIAAVQNGARPAQVAGELQLTDGQRVLFEKGVNGFGPEWIFNGETYTRRCIWRRRCR